MGGRALTGRFFGEGPSSPRHIPPSPAPTGTRPLSRMSAKNLPVRGVGEDERAATLPLRWLDCGGQPVAQEALLVKFGGFLRANRGNCAASEMSREHDALSLRL
jgi:hypothetical protein